MYLINEVINNLKNTGRSNVYIRNKGSKKYSIIKFWIIDGYLTIVSEHHIFDKAIWNGERFNPRAHEVQTKRILQYAANPKVKEELDSQDVFEDRLNAIMALLMAHTLKPGNAEVEYLYKKTNNLEDNAFYWATFLADRVIRACELSYQELTDFIDMDIKGVAKVLKDKIDENDEDLNYPNFNTITMSELYLGTIGKAYDEVKRIDAKTKSAANNKEFREAYKKWQELSYSAKPIVNVPKSKRNEGSLKAR